MLLHIEHKTQYDYNPPVKTAQHMAHLRPLHTARQQLLSHELAITPTPVQQSRSEDAYGNTRHFFSLPIQHRQLEVVANSLVRTSPLPAVNNDIPWESVRDCLRYHRQAAYEPAVQFAFASPHVPRHQQFEDYAAASFASHRPLMEAARDLMARIHHDFDYDPEATDASTPPLDALRMRKGVCQDFAHVMLACLRSLGLAARYVSGYLLTEPPPGQPRLQGADASHAWISLYVPSADGAGTWLDLDPTNRREAGEDYVVLAVGRDFSDVSPLRGVIHGGGHHRLHVAVTMTPSVLTDTGH